MTPERFQRISEIFEATRGLTAAARVAALDEVCGDDADLRVEVEALLAHHEKASNTFEDSAVLERVAAAAVAAGIDALPARIGDYAIVRRIGAGGMGIVYEARQSNPRRTVALKVIRTHGAPEQMLRRFELEGHLLGQLEHPGIARVYEAGTYTADHGPQPYLAMEYIDGAPIHHYADRLELGTRDRLQLFAAVCDAVQHAHSKGVIHRDLKPANILVQDEGADSGTHDEPRANAATGLRRDSGMRSSMTHLRGYPKILDFGVARVTDADLQVCTLQTEAGQLVGTLPYMSPEQVAGDPDAVDTRADVYSLGVVLFELLAGQLPYALDASALVRAAEIIRDIEPPRLGSFDRAWRGDLETIVAKALEKERSRRYATAAQFAADIRRFLADEPIVARPATALYQLRKFARRNQTAVVGAVAVTIALIGGIITTSYGMLQARSARDLAERRLIIADEARGAALAAQALAIERLRHANDARSDAERAQALAVERLGIADDARAEAEATNQFLKDMLWRADPASAQGQELTLRQLLDDASAEMDARPPANRRVEARVRDTIGRTYEMIGRYDEATHHLQRSYAITLELAGPGHADTLWARFDLANHYFQMERATEALELLEGLYEQSLTLGDDEVDLPPRVLSLQGRLAKQASDYAGAIEYFTRAVEGFHAIDRLGPAARDLGEVATLHSRMGNHDQAVHYMERAIDVTADVHGADSAHVAGLLSNLGVLLSRQNKYVAAEEALRQALVMKRATHPQGHPLTAGTMIALANVLARVGQYDEALRLMEEAVPAMRAARGPDSFHTALAMGTRANIKRRLGAVAEAEAEYREALAILRAALPPRHPYTARTLMPLAVLVAERGAGDEANMLAEEGVAIYREVSGARHDWTAAVMVSRGYVAHVCGDDETAWRVLQAARDILVDNGSRNIDLADCLTHMGDVALARGDARTAEVLYLESLEVRSAIEDVAPLSHAMTRSGLGASLLAQGHNSAAGPLIMESHQIIVGLPEASTGHIQRTTARVAQLRAAGD